MSTDDTDFGFGAELPEDDEQRFTPKEIEELESVAQRLLKSGDAKSIDEARDLAVKLATAPVARASSMPPAGTAAFVAAQIEAQEKYPDWMRVLQESATRVKPGPFTSVGELQRLVYFLLKQLGGEITLTQEDLYHLSTNLPSNGGMFFESAADAFGDVVLRVQEYGYPSPLRNAMKPLPPHPERLPDDPDDDGLLPF